MTSILDNDYNCEITCEDGSKFLLNANRLHNQQLDHWEGWHCEAGSTRLWIEHNGAVYSGECKNDYLGNIFSDWNILMQPTVCKKNRCSGCTDDLLISKKNKG